MSDIIFQINIHIFNVKELINFEYHLIKSFFEIIKRFKSFFFI